MVNEIDYNNANAGLLQAINVGVQINGNIRLYSQNAMNDLKTSETNDLVDIQIKNKDGQNILHGMASLGAPETFKAFIEAGLDVNSVDNNGNTPLHLISDALVQRNPELAGQVIKAAIDSNADLSKENNRGVSALNHIKSLGEMLDLQVKADFRAANGDPEKVAGIVKKCEEYGKFMAEIPKGALVKPKISDKDIEAIDATSTSEKSTPEKGYNPIDGMPDFSKGDPGTPGSRAF